MTLMSTICWGSFVNTFKDTKNCRVAGGKWACPFRMPSDSLANGRHALGVFVWKEFVGADARARGLFGTMLAACIFALVLIARAYTA